MGDVVYQSGYIIISCVIQPLADDEWFGCMVKDIQAIRGTNNVVNIFNGKTNDRRRDQILFSK